MKTELILHFIRKYYVVDCYRTLHHNKSVNITIRDYSDAHPETGQIVPISLIKHKEITFLWQFGKKMTGIDLYHKKWAHHLPGDIMKTFRHPRTQDFFKFLIEQKVPCIIPLNEVPLEFPNLFTNGLQEAVEIGTTKDNIQGG